MKLSNEKTTFYDIFFLTLYYVIKKLQLIHITTLFVWKKNIKQLPTNTSMEEIMFNIFDSNSEKNVLISVEKTDHLNVEKSNDILKSNPQKQWAINKQKINWHLF